MYMIKVQKSKLIKIIRYDDDDDRQINLRSNTHGCELMTYVILTFLAGHLWLLITYEKILLLYLCYRENFTIVLMLQGKFYYCIYVVGKILLLYLCYRERFTIVLMSQGKVYYCTYVVGKILKSGDYI